jgi:hypothetical protein
MVGDREGEIGPHHLAAAPSHLLEGVEGTLMQEMPVDEEQRVASVPRHDRMAVPELVDEGARLMAHDVVFALGLALDRPELSYKLYI